MQAGKLTRRLTLQRSVAGEDAAGQPVAGWEDVATVWADVRHLGGLEAIKAGAPVSTVQASMRIRYRPDADASMRALVDGQAYSIAAVMQDAGQRDYTDLIAEAVNV